MLGSGACVLSDCLAPSKQLIYGCHNHYLGDVWSSVCYMLANNLSVISRYTAGPGGQHDNVGSKIKEVCSVLEGGERIVLSDKLPNRRIGPQKAWGGQYASTRKYWQGGLLGSVCYQFDGRSDAKLKNLKPGALELFKTIVHNPRRLGSHVSLAECMNIATESIAFVGVCSGMSHLCHSVGVPMFIIGPIGHVKRFHGTKIYTHCVSMRDFIEKFTTWCKATGATQT